MTSASLPILFLEAQIAIKYGAKFYSPPRPRKIPFWGPAAGGFKKYNPPLPEKCPLGKNGVRAGGDIISP